MKILELVSKPNSGDALAGTISELLGAGGIEVEVRGVNIAYVRVRLRRLAPADISVHIPIGTFFRSKDAAVQDMIGRRPARVTLKNDRWKSVWLEAACASRVKNVPTPADRFAILGASRQEDLRCLAPVLPQAQSSFAIQQAAVWIVSDDASFRELGHLQSQAGARLITPEHAVRAMQMCVDVGIDVRKKKIWNDRHSLLHDVDEPELREWLTHAGQGLEFSFLSGVCERCRRLWGWLKRHRR